MVLVGGKEIRGKGRQLEGRWGKVVTRIQSSARMRSFTAYHCENIVKDSRQPLSLHRWKVDAAVEDDTGTCSTIFCRCRDCRRRGLY